MREWEIRWVKRGASPTDGQYIPLPDHCHHGRYVSGMVVREINPEPDRCPRCLRPKNEEQMHGHYVCMNCKQITVGCCDGNE